MPLLFPPFAWLLVLRFALINSSENGDINLIALIMWCVLVAHSLRYLLMSIMTLFKLIGCWRDLFVLFVLFVLFSVAICCCCLIYHLASFFMLMTSSVHPNDLLQWDARVRIAHSSRNAMRSRIKP